jgi:hypothetical protein
MWRCSTLDIQIITNHPAPVVAKHAAGVTAQGQGLKDYCYD